MVSLPHLLDAVDDDEESKVAIRIPAGSPNLGFLVVGKDQLEIVTN